MAAGQLTAAVFTGSPRHAASMERLATPIEPGRAPDSLVRIRVSPLREADPLAADWTRAMRPAASRGPFVSESGECFWIDTFLLPQLVTIMANSAFGKPQIVARLPVRGGATSSSTLRLARGSAWLPSSMLVAGRPTNEFVGVRIVEGTLTITGTTSAANSTITIDGAWKVALRLTLDRAGDPAPADGPGADAAAARVELPATVAISVDAEGLEGIELADARATAYGSGVTLKRSADRPFYDELTRSVVVPCAVSPSEFAFVEVRSALWKIHGRSRIGRSGWALPIAVTAPNALGEADGTGSLWLDLNSSLSVKWSGVAHAAAPPRTVLGLSPGAITIWATLNAGEVTQRLKLWNEAGVDPPRRSSIDVTSATGSVAIHFSKPGSEAVLVAGRTVAHLDRPLAVDGGRVAVRMPVGWLVLVETAGATTAGVLAVDPAAGSAPHLAFALENALIKARPPEWLAASGPLTSEGLASGWLILRSAYRFVLPTLPDPYAANFEPTPRTDADKGWATASVLWATPASPALSFTIPLGASSSIEPLQERWPGSTFAIRGVRNEPLRVLVDVSSNADQLGVVFPEAPAGSSRVAGLSLVTPAREAAVLTLPPISWEPMLTKPPAPSATGDVALPPPPHDGGPAVVSADTVELKPVAPVPLLATYHDAIQLKRHFVARLPLPFGLIAHVDTRRESQPLPTSRFDGTVFVNQPRFDSGLIGGLQVAVRAADSPPGGRDRTLLGYVEPCNDDDYAKGVLSENVLTRFGGDFGAGTLNGVPVKRYELSGYGASLFSDWRDLKAVGPAIVQARFDVLVGRTAHEVIQMQSFLDPYHARLVRTITIDRKPGGWVLREDSGWVATSDGRFEFAGDANALPTTPAPAAFIPEHVHAGAAEAVVNIRNIRLDGAQRVLPRSGAPDAVTWQPVRFDADVLFADAADPRLLIAAGSAQRRVPSRDMTGWIQIDGPTYTTKSDDGTQTVERVRPASGPEISDLLALLGPARGPIACKLLLGGTPTDPGLTVRTSTIDVSCAEEGGIPRLVVAVRGSPALPRDGAWSLARLDVTDTAPNALDPSFPVPVVRPNGWTTGSNRWHLADPADILQLGDTASPAKRYGLVQSLGAQKIFFARPRIGNDPKPINVPKPPQLADVGALLNSAGIFPGLAETFDFRTLNALAVNGGEIGFSEQFEIGSASALKRAVLADLGGPDAIQLVIEYHDEKDAPTVASIAVKPAAAPRWSISLERVAFTVRFRGNALISLFAHVKADEHTAPTVENLNVRYEGILGALQTIFTNVQQVARFLPGGAGAGLRVAFSHGHLTVRNEFALPNLPLGAGQITDIAVAMGLEVSLTPFDVTFVAGLGSSQKPFRWIVSPLAGTGVVQVGIGKKGLDVLVQGGLGLGLAIDLGIASGSASITLAVELNTGPDPFEIKGILSGRASVDVLAGLASATITLAAGIGIIPPDTLLHSPYLPPSLPPPSPIGPFTIGLTASVAVGIHLTVCWVVDVDFDAYWQFRQDITTPAIPIPLL
jgi:hypothetical protein